MSIIKSTRIEVPTGEGYSITSYCFEPTTTAAAGVIIAPAMAVEQSFYEAFATNLAKQGYRVWTFDYLGIGESKYGSMRACTADVSSWINTDFDAVVKQASDAMAKQPLFVLGHSLGGLITPLLPSINKLSGVVNIAVGSGAKRHMQPRLQRSTPLLWHVLTPILCKLFGYFPGSRIGIMGDIPRHALFQWRDWCLNAEYLLDADPKARAAYAEVSYPMLSLFFNDDELLLESGGHWLHDAYTGTSVDYRVIKANEIKSPRIGHFGFFKQRQEDILWPIVNSWLKQQLSLAT